MLHDKAWLAWWRLAIGYWYFVPQSCMSSHSQLCCFMACKLHIMSDKTISYSTIVAMSQVLVHAPLLNLMWPFSEWSFIQAFPNSCGEYPLNKWLSNEPASLSTVMRSGQIKRHRLSRSCILSQIKSGNATISTDTKGYPIYCGDSILIKGRDKIIGFWWP